MYNIFFCNFLCNLFKMNLLNAATPNEKHVAILLDNAGGHNVSEETEKEQTNITLKYFEPGYFMCSTRDQGIIVPFKAYFRKGICIC